MSVWIFQVHGAELRALAGIAGAHDEVIEDVLAKLNLWRDRHAADCEWGLDYVPHDARVRELGSGKTRVEAFVKLGRKPALVPAHKVDDGINAARHTIGQTWFDAEHCEQSLEFLRQYRADYDEERKVFRNEPFHDWTSHAADAFRYMAMAWRIIRADPPKKVERPKSFHELSLDELWKLTDEPRNIRV